MKKITISRISVKDFKGQTFDANLYDNTLISGKNGVGKTTVKNAFMWLLTGRTDANGRINHELYDNTKPLTKDTPEAIVECMFTIDKSDHTLKRVARAKFTRPKGSTEWVKSPSDEYTYYVDGMEYTASEYNAWIEQNICNVEMLPACIDGAFFSRMAEGDKLKGRELLVKVVGECKPDAGEFKNIQEDLVSEKAENILKKSRELKRAYSDDIRDLETEKSSLQSRLPEIVVDEKRIEECRAAYKEAEKRMKAAEKKLASKIDKGKLKSEDLSKKRNAYESEIAALKEAIKHEEKDKDRYMIYLSDERKCPTCGQTIKKTSAIEKERVVRMIGECSEKINKYSERIKKLTAGIAKVTAQMNGLLDLGGNIDSLKDERDALTKASVEFGIAYKSEEDRNKTTERISEIDKEIRDTGKKIVECELKEMEAQEYMQEAAEMLSESVNSKIEGFRVQMFETLKNGENKPSCTLTDAEGIKYSTLNFSARIRADIAFSRMFCKMLGVNLPCFVDECSVFDSASRPDIKGTQMVYMQCSDEERLTITKTK